ncbi:MAG: thioesterase family protein [Oscillospiraceae bacterium]|jgi:predicted thioesterase|nr:thioesterase family protein [Oscillospiraceae bacterium]
MALSSLKGEYTVTREMLADHAGSGSLPVLATPVLSALFEGAAARIAQESLEEGDTTVGTEITVKHLAPTPCGGKITVEAKLLKREGRIFRFELSARDRAGTIATGSHVRVCVHSERFIHKAEARKTADES